MMIIIIRYRLESAHNVVRMKKSSRVRRADGVFKNKAYTVLSSSICIWKVPTTAIP
jgi:hypothetical protein